MLPWQAWNSLCRLGCPQTCHYVLSCPVILTTLIGRSCLSESAIFRDSGGYRRTPTFQQSGKPRAKRGPGKTPKLKAPEPGFSLFFYPCRPSTMARLVLAPHPRPSKSSLTQAPPTSGSPPPSAALSTLPVVRGSGLMPLPKPCLLHLTQFPILQ